MAMTSWDFHIGTLGWLADRVLLWTAADLPPGRGLASSINMMYAVLYGVPLLSGTLIHREIKSALVILNIAAARTRRPISRMLTEAKAILMYVE